MVVCIRLAHPGRLLTMATTDRGLPTDLFLTLRCTDAAYLLGKKGFTKTGRSFISKIFYGSPIYRMIMRRFKGDFKWAKKA